MGMAVRIADVVPTRPCRFCLALQDDSVFVDFDVDASNRVFAVRASFDGYGCCTTTSGIGKMSIADSVTLLQMVESKSLDLGVTDRILRQYFLQNQQIIWGDALAKHELL